MGRPRSGSTFGLFLFLTSSREISRVGEGAVRAVMEGEVERGSRARSRGARESWHDVGYF